MNLKKYILSSKTALKYSELSWVCWVCGNPVLVYKKIGNNYETTEIKNKENNLKCILNTLKIIFKALTSIKFLNKFYSL